MLDSALFIISAVLTRRAAVITGGRRNAQEMTDPFPKELREFVKRNASWYAVDYAMTQEAIKYLDALTIACPGSSLAEKLQMVEEDIRLKFSKNRPWTPKSD